MDEGLGLWIWSFMFSLLAFNSFNSSIKDDAAGMLSAGLLSAVWSGCGDVEGGVSYSSEEPREE
jgi:hypothetical protein